MDTLPADDPCTLDHEGPFLLLEDEAIKDQLRVQSLAEEWVEGSQERGQTSPVGEANLPVRIGVDNELLQLL